MVQPKLWTVGAILWGDRDDQASELGNEETPARNPLGTDPDWNDLVNGTLWTEPDSATRNKVVGPVGTTLLTLEQQGAGGSGTSMGISPASTFNVNAATYALLRSSGSVTVDGVTSGTINGLEFAPNILPVNNPTLSRLSSVWVGGIISGAGTITSRNFLHVQGSSVISTSVTTVRGLWVQTLQSVAAPGTAVGVQIDSIGLGTIRQGLLNNSSLYLARIDTKTGNYTMITNDFGILADATSAGFTVTLPDALNKGHVVAIQKTDSSANVVTVSRAGTDTIEGATSATLSSQYDSVLLIADGAGIWHRLQRAAAPGGAVAKESHVMLVLEAADTSIA